MAECVWVVEKAVKRIICQGKKNIIFLGMFSLPSDFWPL